MSSLTLLLLIACSDKPSAPEAPRKTFTQRCKEACAEKGAGMWFECPYVASGFSGTDCCCGGSTVEYIK